MATYRNQLPQLDADIFLTDGGLETSLIYDQGQDLPQFAAFTLLSTPDGQAALERYFDEYAGIAARDGVGVVLETPTWRASADWGPVLGFDLDQLRELNRAAVDQLVAIRRRHETDQSPVVISGCIGPRGDGYSPDSFMSAEEAADYHAFQAEVFADSDADLVTAITMTYPGEAIGIVEATRRVGMPVVISFTVETDGRLPNGQTLGQAIDEVDAATGAYAAYFMINCAHPDHFANALEPGAPWTARIGGLRANASRRSHAELDEATELDAGDAEELAGQYRDLHQTFPHLVVLGGCCGTNHEHVDAISRACAVG
jgi:S-methylmethionine-dependent homocysteine/selenocysteine methylase